MACEHEAVFSSVFHWSQMVLTIIVQTGSAGISVLCWLLYGVSFTDYLCDNVNCMLSICDCY